VLFVRFVQIAGQDQRTRGMVVSIALVTLNVDGFAPAAHFRLAVLTPGAFWRQLNEESC
jgi:hypothetical protein